MPVAPPSLCTEHGCGTLTTAGKCDAHRREKRRVYDQRRPNSSARGYGTEWQRTARSYLGEHPQCECDDCLLLPTWRRPRATDVDHIDGLGPLGEHGHDWRNLRAMTHGHHSRRTARDQGNAYGTRAPRRCD